MEPDLRIDLNTAIGNWIAAREEFLSNSGSDILDRFHDSNMELFAAFVEDWHGDLNDPNVARAFALFRKFLTQEIDRGDSDRRCFHPCPVTVTRA